MMRTRILICSLGLLSLNLIFGKVAEASPQYLSPSNLPVCNINFPIFDNSCTASSLYTYPVSAAPGTALGVDVILSEVRIIVDHSWDADLDIYLRSPAGIEVELSTDNGGGADNYGDPTDLSCQTYTTFSMEACVSIEQGVAPFTGTYLPEGNLYDFNDASDPNGDWVLKICDDGGGDVGFLHFLELVFETNSCLQPTALQLVNSGATAVDLSWSSENSNCQATYLEYGPPGFTPGTDNNAGGGTLLTLACPINLPYTLNGLEELSDYDIYIREACAADVYSKNSCVLSISTECSTLPISLTEDFNTQVLCASSCGATCPIAGTWHNRSDDDYDWLIDEGGTASGNTGPSDDVEGGGRYLYTEGSGASCRNGNLAILESNCIQVFAPSGTCHLSFFYHMFGNGIGRLEFQVKSNGAANWLPIWSQSSEQGDEWIKTFIDLGFYHDQIVQFRFVAIGGDNFRSDLAIDQIQFYGSMDVGQGAFTFYADLDNDGYGDPMNSINRCFAEVPSGFQTNALDCDDSRSDIHPDAMEVACNGIDENCNGSDDDAILPDPQVTNQSVCLGTSAVIKPDSSPLGEWHWFDLPSGGQLLAIGDSLVTPALTAPAIYYVQDSAVGCYSQRIAVNIDINPLPDIFTMDQPIICRGEDFDLRDLTIADRNGVGGELTYHNFSPANPTNELPSPIVNPTGDRTYTVLMTSVDGCTSELDIRLTVLTPPEADIAPGDSIALCRNARTILTALADSGIPPYEFQWSSGQSTDIISVNAGSLPNTAVYRLSVRDSQGCQDTDSIKVTTLPSISSVAIDSTANVNFCDGNDGWIALTPLDGLAPYHYAWSGPESGSATDINGAYQINQLSQGAYRITISESSPQACQIILPAVVINGPSVIIDPNVATVDVSCFGESDGAVDLTITAGNPQFVWSNGDTTEDLSGVGAGIYSVTVSDGACSNTLNGIVVEQPEELSIFILNNTAASCQGSGDGWIEATASGGVGPYSFSWSSGSTNEIADQLLAGQYNLTVTDANGCTLVSESIPVGEAAPLAIQPVFIKDPSCFGEADGAINLEVTGGTPPYTYDWSNGMGQRDITGLVANDYNVTVTDANTCTQILSGVSINEPALLTIALLQETDASCNGVDDGTIDIQVAGGTAPYRYLWSNGVSNQNLDDLPPGLYTVTVTDEEGCRAISDVYQIEAPELMTLGAVFIQEPACEGIDDGFISIQIEGGTSPLFYDWNVVGNSPVVNNLGVGTYEVTVYDSRGCQFTPPPFELDILFPLEAQLDLKADVSCFGAQNGGIFISVPGNPSDYAYEWSNGASSQDLIGLAPGDYWATITGNDGCIIYTDTFTIAQPNTLEVVLSAVEPPTCNGLDDGSIDVQIIGGTAPYTYSWSNGYAGEDLFAASAGEYILTVLDANGCPVSSPSFLVPEPEKIEIAVNEIDPIGCDEDGEGAIELMVEGGTAPYLYAWSNGDSSEVLNVDEAGVYGIQLTDANGCLAIKSNLVIPQLFDSLPVRIAEIAPIICAGEASGTLIPEIIGGQAPFQFNWSNGMTDSIQRNLIAGTYALTITDDNGCIGILDTVELESPTPIDFTVLEVIPANCSGEASGSISLSVSGGVGPYTYLWSHGAVSQNPDFLAAGNYTVIITDSLGCELISPQSILVEEPAPFVLSTIDKTEPLCFGDSNGALRLLINGGTPGYHFRWITGDTTNFLEGISAGSYSCTITDDNGCVLQTGEISLEQPDELLVDIVNTEKTDVAYCLPNSGGVLLNLQGGSMPYQYFWNNGARSKDLQNVGPGQYFCNVEDDNGCLLQTPIYSIEPTDSIRSQPIATPDIDGASNGSATAIVNGGRAPYAFEWGGGQTDSLLTNLPFGTYYLTITDADGCIHTDSVEVEFIVNTSSVFEDAVFSYYPNPTTDYLSIDLQFPTPQSLQIELYGADGRRLITRASELESHHQQKLDLQSLSAGLYYIRLITDDGRMGSFPFIKIDE